MYMGLGLLSCPARRSIPFEIAFYSIPGLGSACRNLGFLAYELEFFYSLERLFSQVRL